MANLSNINGKFVVDTAGNIGVGTLTPRSDANTTNISIQSSGTARLFVNNTGASGKEYAIYSSANGDFGIFDYGAVSARLIIDSSGNVGIGNANPQTNLTIGSAQGNSLEFTYDSTNSYRNIISNHWDSSTDTRMDFNIGRTGNVAPVPVMSVGYGGNVGIGTTSPTSKLTIDNGSAAGGSLLKSSSSDYTAHFIGNTGTGSAGIYMDAMDGDFIGSNYGFIGQNNAGYMEYNVSPSSPLPYHYFAQSVGIGTTSPNQKLEVSGNTYVTGYVQASSALIGLKNGYATLGSNSTATGIALSRDFLPSSYPDLIINPDGKVGIGTASPNAKLDVDGDVNTTGYLANTLEFSTYFGSGTTVIATLNGSFESGTTAVASIEYVGLYAYAGGDNVLGIIMASTRRSINNTAWSNVNDETVHVAGSTSKEPTLYWDNGLLKITVGTSVQISCRVRITYHGVNTGLTRNHSA